MKLLLIMIFLRPVLCAIMGNKPVCPGHSSVSVLNPSAEKNDPVCDFCEHTFEYISPIFPLHKVVADCRRITRTGSKTQLQWFSDVLGIMYTNKMRPHKGLPIYDDPICECDPCSELVNLNSPFVKVCAPNMTDDMMSERLRLCKKVKQDQEELWFIYQNLKEECFALTGENITFSLCECDVCWLLFYETSDFMTKCGNHMDQAMVNKLFSSCEKIMCDPVELMFFKKDLELTCNKKLNATFDFPQCACEECWLLFKTESDFMQKCGLGMSDGMLKKLIKDCYASLDNLDNFMTFIDNLQVTCQNKGKEQFQHQWCYCLDCLLFEDHENEIWKDCLSHMSESVRSTKRNECLNATLGGTLGQYKSNLFQYCHMTYGFNVSFPKCGSCSRTDLSVVFVMEYSPSIRRHGYLPTVQGIWTPLMYGSIGQNKSHFGLVRFAYCTHLIFDLNPGYFTYWSRYHWFKHLQYFSTLPAAVLDDTLEFVGDMFRHVNDTRAKYAVIITEGHITDFARTTLKEASETIPEDVTVLVVGLGYTDVQNLLTIARNKPQNVYNYYPTPPLNDIYLIVGDLMRNIGC